MLYHTTIIKDNRCLDLLLTEDEIAWAVTRALSPNNKEFINSEKCCSCWPVTKPPKCNFWTRILGTCMECDS
jgi:hypothetical protein